MRKVFAALLIAALLMGAGAVAVDAQSYFQKFENLWAKTLTTTGDVAVGDDMTVAGDLTVSGSLVGAPEFDGGTVSDPTTFGSTLVVTGATRLVGAATADSNVTISGSLVVSGGTMLVGNTDVTGNFEVIDHIGNSGQEYYFPGDAVAVLSGGTITPSTALVELTAAGTVGTSLGTCTEGQWVMFVNTAAQTITITDTGTTILASDWAGGQNDTLTLTCVGISWYEVGRSVN